MQVISEKMQVICMICNINEKKLQHKVKMQTMMWESYILEKFEEWSSDIEQKSIPVTLLSQSPQE